MMMTDLETARARAQVWLPAMRRACASTPGAFTVCPCQTGPSAHCEDGDHVLFEVAV